MASFTPIPALEAPRIAQYALLSPGQKGLDIESAQVEHRLEIINAWGIKPGSRILEIGCGQGNCTTVLAEFVGPEGHVDAFDPASPDYGAPFTLRQAQEHISKGPMGSRITWFNQDVSEYIANNAAVTWDYIVFCHSLWYFDSPDRVQKLLQSLSGRGTLLIAEYALQATEPSAVSHVLAVIARASLEAQKKSSEENVQSLLGPRELKHMVEEKGWTLREEKTVVPGKGLLDGSWEVSTVKGEGFLKEIEEGVESPRHRLVLRSARDAVLSAVKLHESERVRTMDVWVASFK